MMSDLQEIIDELKQEEASVLNVAGILLTVYEDVIIPSDVIIHVDDDHTLSEYVTISIVSFKGQ